jgi:hypothetical protein
MSEFGSMSGPEVDAVKQRLISQISEMTDAEIEIVTKSEESLAFYIAGAFKALAAAIGYVIALPIAFAVKVAHSLYEGFKGGFAAGFRSARIEL